VRPRKVAKPRKAAKRDPLANSKKLLKLVKTSLEDGKAEDIVTIALSGKSTMADFMVVATGRSSRQVIAMAERLRAQLKAEGVKEIALEGAPRGDWILIDGGDVIVHLFRPEVREFYGLEKMWSVEVSVSAAPETKIQAKT